MKLIVKLRSQVRRLQVDAQPEESENNDGSEKPGASKSRAQYMRNYRAKIKANREMYKLHRELESDRLREFRKGMSAAKRRKYQEQSKLRMRKFRSAKKAAPVAQLPKGDEAGTSRQTRSMEESRQKKRAYWRQTKQEERSKLSKQKKRWIREKDRLRKRKLRTKHPVTVTPEKPTPHDFQSNTARKQAIYRARMSLPQTSASKYADVVVGLIQTKSPRKKAALMERNIIKETDGDLINVVKKTCGSLPAINRRYFVAEMTNHLDGKHGLKKTASRHLGIRQRYLRKYARLRRSNKNVEQRQVRSDSTNVSVVQAVQEYYQKPHVSTIMPNKKGMGANAKPKYVLQRSITETYKGFCKENPEQQIGRSRFAELRPNHVLVQSKSKLYQCLCETCTNVDMAIKALNQEVTNAKCECRVIDRYHLSELTLCKKEGIHGQLTCIDRQCKECGVQLLDDFFKPLIDAQGEKQVSWQQWGKTVYGDNKKRVSLQRASGTISELISQLKHQLEKFACHLFQARWQQEQFHEVSKHLPKDTVVIVMDFAENYSCTMQNEVQSAHWYVAQVTLHPMVAYYMCNGCDDNSPIREAIDIITDDMKHDAHAVQHFVSTAVTHLARVRGVAPQRLIEFSDGCTGQYKSRIPFMDVSYGKEDLGIPRVERHYFGSSHGKNPCDGEGGVVKNAASRAVHSEADVIITDAMSFFEFCDQRLTKAPVIDGKCNHSRRVFYYIANGVIDRKRPSRSDVVPLPGTRHLHAAVGLEPHKLMTRRLSCFCEACNSDDTTNCFNGAYIEEWQQRLLKPRCLPNDPIDVHVPDGVDVEDNTEAGEPEEAEDGTELADVINISDDLPVIEVADLNVSLTEVLESMIPDNQASDPTDASTLITPSHPGNGATSDRAQDSPPLTSPPYSEGDFVLARLPMGKRHATFVAEILKLDGEEARLQYMEQVRPGVYKWPTTADISTEPISNIVEKMQVPVLMEEQSSSRVQYFQFA